jgi:prepilin-type N-terminal cleavage/methylation domain-containing protein
MRRMGGFTLVEIMIVVSIIALLAAMALPSFLRAREQAQNAKFINALLVATGAFEMYNIEHSAFPPDVNRAVVPPGMALYFGPTLDWTKPTPIGGNWDWDYNQFGLPPAFRSWAHLQPRSRCSRSIERSTTAT